MELTSTFSTIVSSSLEPDSSSFVVAACAFFDAALILSVHSALLAMLGKQWLGRYLQHVGRSMIERCRDRQRKLNALKRWPVHPFIEAPLVLLQISVTLFSCGFCGQMWTKNSSITWSRISLTTPGVVFYLAILIIGLTPPSPVETPASIALRRLLGMARRGILSLVAHSKWTLSRTGPSNLQPLLGNIPLQAQLWLAPTVLDTLLYSANASDIYSIIWIFQTITVPNALDIATWLAGMVRWFPNGLGAEPPYDQIFSIFKACFDPIGRVDPELRDRAYYSARAILWIRVCAMCKSAEVAQRFPVQTFDYDETSLDPDLKDLLVMCNQPDVRQVICQMHQTCSAPPSLLPCIWNGYQMRFSTCLGRCGVDRPGLHWFLMTRTPRIRFH